MYDGPRVKVVYVIYGRGLNAESLERDTKRCFRRSKIMTSYDHKGNVVLLLLLLLFQLNLCSVLMVSSGGTSGCLPAPRGFPFLAEVPFLCIGGTLWLQKKYCY